MAYIDKITINSDQRDLHDVGAVRFDSAQTLTDAQKTQARSNISVPSTDDLAYTDSLLTTYGIARTRNLINAQEIQAALYNTSQGQYVANSSWRATAPIQVEAGKKYAFSYGSGSGYTLSHYYVFNSAMEYLGNATKSSAVITIPSDYSTAAYLILDTNNAAAIANQATWQLEEGTAYTRSFIPYYQTVLDARLSQDTGSSTVDVMSQNAVTQIVDGYVRARTKNLISGVRIGWFYDSGKSAYTESANWDATEHIPVIEGVTYKFSVNHGTEDGVPNKIFGIGADRVFIEEISASSGVFTVPEDDGIAWVVICSNNTNTKLYVDTWQLEAGSINTAYEPYYLEKYRTETEYWPGYVRDEVSRVAAQLYTKLSLGNVAIFGFNTDQHITIGNYSEVSVRYGLRALAKLTEMIPFNFVCLGGDDCGYKTADLTVGGIIQDVCVVAEAVSGAKCPIFNMTGNHDAYQNNNTITSGTIFDMKGKKVVINKWNDNTPDFLTTNFVFDDVSSKIRYIYFDTNYHGSTYGGRSDYTSTMAETFLSGALSGTPTGYKIVILSHHALNSGLGEDFIGPLAYQTIIEPYASQIICCVNGHAHKDGSETLNGILYIETTSAGIYSISDGYTRTLGTAAETAFDVFVIDQENEKVYTIRYGAGGATANRELSY